MAEIQLPQEVDEQEGFFEAEQIDNFILGINRAAAGAQQAYIEAQETLGLVPEGSAVAETQDLQKELDILQGAVANEQAAKGAGISTFAGEAVPLFLAPLGLTIPRAAAIGAASGATFFQEDVNDSRLPDVLTGAATGGLFRALLRGGKARQQLEGAVNEMDPRFTGPRDLVGPRQSPFAAFQGPRDIVGPRVPSKPQGPADLVGPRTPRNIQQAARVQEQGFPRGTGGLNAQRATEVAARNAARRTAKEVKPVKEANAIQRAMRQMRNGEAVTPKLRRKVEVMTRNAARKSQKALEQSQARLAQLGRRLDGSKKPHIRASIQKSMDKEQRGLVAKMAVNKAILQAQQGHFGNLKPRVQVPSEPPLRGPELPVEPRSPESSTLGRGEEIAPQRATQEVSAKPINNMTKAELEQDILNNDPFAMLPSRQTKADLIKQADVARRNKKARAGGPGGRQAGFVESDLANTLGAAGVGAVGGAAIAGANDANPLAGAAIGAVTLGLGGRALSRRLGAKGDDAIITNKQRKMMREADDAGGEYVANLTRAAKARDITGETVSNLVTGAKNVLNQYAGAIMTRLEVLAPRVATALANTEFQQHFRAGQWLSEGDIIFDRINAAKLTDAQAEQFKITLLNSTKNAEKMMRGLGHTDAADAVAEMDGLLRGVGDYLGEVGLGKGLRQNYFPRQVVDTSKFANIQEVDTYLDQLAKKKGIDLTDFEKENAIAEIINGAMVRGNESLEFARASSNLKRRTNKVTRENVDAYGGLKASFNDYINSVTNQVERRRFFDTMGVKADDLGPNAENMQTVGKRLAESLAKGDITKEQADEVATLIRMRFGPGEQAPHRAVQNFKNLTYAGLLGNPFAAMTQLGDMALSAHRNGFMNTTAALVETLANRGRGVRGLDKESLMGIRNAATDFASNVKTRDVLDWTLRKSGFQFADSLGKNTFINAAMRKAQKMNPEDFKQKWGPIFDPDAPPGGPTPRTDKLFNDVRNFKGINDGNKEDVGFMLWNELSGVQPIALSALPEKYLQHPNGRMAYMLQSFTLKLFDVMKKDIYQQAQKGNYKQAAKAATNLTAYFTLMNSNVDMAKNFILQKDAAIPDVVMNNTLKMMGLNKFLVDSVGREGLGQAALGQIAPPTVLFDALSDPKTALGLVPIGGKALASTIK